MGKVDDTGKLWEEALKNKTIIIYFQQQKTQIKQWKRLENNIMIKKWLKKTNVIDNAEYFHTMRCDYPP